MSRTLKIMNLVFFALMIIINALANLLPIGYGNTGSISNKYPNLFTPAPFTFSIWGVIYTLVGFFIIYQFGFINNRIFAEKMIDQIGPFFVISCILNICWLFSWHYDKIELSMIFMLGLLLTLCIITSRLNISDFEHLTGSQSVPFLTKLCIYAFDIYLGWIIAATLANLSVLFVKQGWNGRFISEGLFTVMALIIGMIIGIILVFVLHRNFSAFAIMWAYFGILVRHVSGSGFDGIYPIISTVVLAGMVILLASVLARTMLEI